MFLENYLLLFLDSGLDEKDSDEDDELDVGGLLKRTKKSKSAKKLEFKDREDGFNFLTPSSSIFVNSIDWTNDEQRDLIRNCFITGENDENMDESDNDELDENDLFGSDEDDELKMEVDDDDNKAEIPKVNVKGDDATARSKRLEAKERLKARFNTEYDEQNEAYNALKDENDAQAKVIKLIVQLICIIFS